MELKSFGRFILIAAAVFAFAEATHADMTDQQVVQYVKQQKAAGKPDKTIGAELLQRGVSRQQLERIRKNYTEVSSQSSMQGTDATVDNRMRRQMSTADFRPDSLMFESITIESSAVPEESRKIFGQEVFTTHSLTFEPNQNLATPTDYQLGPGDEVIIDIWGASEDRLRSTISPEGNIVIDQLGPIYLNGMTIEEANNHLRRMFAYKYAGVEEEETDISLTLGQVRTIQVNVLGEVKTPGTYRLSPFSNVFNALYHSGGVSPMGSLRNVEVRRNGKNIGTVDLYSYIFGGKDATGISLREGDVIVVPAYSTLVNVAGEVKRPMYYEMKNGESLADVIRYAGGFGDDAYSDMVTLTRRNGKEFEVHNVSAGDYASYNLANGDSISVGKILDRFANRVQVSGKVMRPGSFALGSKISTLRDLIREADGLTEDAYADRALIFREGPDLTRQVMSVDLGAIMAGNAPDVVLEKNDSIEIAGVREIFAKGDFTIQGFVNNPGEFPYVKRTTVNDIILQAGGLAEGASTARIEVSRRILDPQSLKPLNETSQLFTMAYEEKGGGSATFVLEPYDIVTVRKSPTYMKQRRVAVGGEVVFEGAYTLARRNERLSDLVRRAGGVTDAAYVRGASLTRLMTEDEMRARDEAIRLAQSMQGGQNTDSVSIGKLVLTDRYSVGIHLDKALANPGSDEDLVLQENDALFVPQMVSTVRIQGDVMYPITVAYKKGANLKYYIQQAGGYGSRAKKGNAYVVYMNGTAAKAKGSTPIEPGCQIIVPSKGTSSVNWNAILSVATAGGTLATMAAAVANMLK